MGSPDPSRTRRVVHRDRSVVRNARDVRSWEGPGTTGQIARVTVPVFATGVGGEPRIVFHPRWPRRFDLHEHESVADAGGAPGAHTVVASSLRAALRDQRVSHRRPPYRRMRCVPSLVDRPCSRPNDAWRVIGLNQGHNELCGSPEWAEYLATDVLPKVLDGADLGDHLIEIGPGFGLATDVLMTKVDRVTSVEIDPTYADDLARRFAGSNVEVVEGDGTDLTFADDSFSSAASFTMLHHVASIALQDSLLAEVARVVRSGGVFIGSDSLDSPGFRDFHEGDTCNPVDPSKLSVRLTNAGFREASVTVGTSSDDDDGIVLFVARNA